MLHRVRNRQFGAPPKTFKQISTILDIFNYMQYVILKNTFEEISDDPKMFLTHMNYVVGFRMTLKRAKRKENKDKISKTKYPIVRLGRYTDPFKKYSTESEDQFGEFPYKKEGTYKDRGGYSMFFSGTQDQAHVLPVINKMFNAENLWFDPNGTTSIIFEFMFYNINYDTIVYLAQGMLTGGEGVITTAQRWRTFNPNLYTTGKNNIKLAFIYIFQILFQVMTLYEIIKIIMKICNYAIDVCSGKRIYIYFNDVFSLITIAFAITCIIYWYKLRMRVE
eukprot:TRINITY_DN10489_c0_g2_i1.p1 TRINITY_DN10489_c0_g2~~TRINITY_DN10489_c0_g2_i1.p1  ORF type:complete len:278 (+),score=14.81 TRINITY_DN10489_c0_g2_i1:276-1109(+)